jgi:hypothetical protein
LKAKLFALEWICPELVPRKKRIGCYEKHAPKIKIHVAVKINKVGIRCKQDYIGRQLANFISKKYLISDICRKEAEITNALT